ncbi:hypothetical protein AY607_10545 [Acinetobacter sp. SFA]|nr:hypothetical protein AY607_10545 [Acinetobacter sp. SFA]
MQSSGFQVKESHSKFRFFTTIAIINKHYLKKKDAALSSKADKHNDSSLVIFRIVKLNLKHNLTQIPEKFHF